MIWNQSYLNTFNKIPLDEKYHKIEGMNVSSIEKSFQTPQ